MPSTHPIRYGAMIRGTVYDYTGPGDTLAVHVHDEPNNHITIVTNGLLEVIGDNDHMGRIVSAGEIIVWKAGQPHGFKAITAARMINQLINRNADLTDGPV